MTTRVPGARRSATHGWLNQTAFAGPLSSMTVACTIVSPRRGRRSEMLLI
jgi:hypothetical protein